MSAYSLPPTDGSPSVLHVVAGALFAEGRVLVAQRPPGKHMAGGWEFPGGKLAVDETPLAGLVRELREELDIEVIDAVPVIAYTHHYTDRSILLDLWLVTHYTGTPASAEGQAIKWVRLSELDNVDLLAADKPMIEPLRKALVDWPVNAPARPARPTSM